MMRTWFTGDTHLMHRNIIKYGKRREFSSVEKMNATLVDRWNSVVSRGDVVYHLGDVGFGKPGPIIEVVRALNGQKRLIWGNHDKNLRKSKEFKALFNWTDDLTEVSVEGQAIVLCHYAMHVWNRAHYGVWHLHGHSHGSMAPDPGKRRIDVGVDAWDWAPVEFQTIKAIMDKKTFVPVDRHVREDPEE